MHTFAQSLLPLYTHDEDEDEVADRGDGTVWLTTFSAKQLAEDPAVSASTCWHRSDNLSCMRQVLEQVGSAGCPKHKPIAESAANALGVSLCFRLDEEAWSSAGAGITIGGCSVESSCC